MLVLGGALLQQVTFTGREDRASLGAVSVDKNLVPPSQEPPHLIPEPPPHLKPEPPHLKPEPSHLKPEPPRAVSPSNLHNFTFPSDPQALSCQEPQSIDSNRLRKVIDSIENEEEAGIYVVWREAYKPKVFELPQSVDGYLDQKFCENICSEGGSRGFRGCEPESNRVDEMYLNIILTTCSFADKGQKFKGGVYNEHMYMVANHAGAVPSFQRKEVVRLDKLAIGLAPYSDDCSSHFFSSTSPMVLTLQDVLPDDVKVSVNDERGEFVSKIEKRRE